MIRTLLERGAVTDRPNRHGWVPLAYSYSHDVETYFVSLIQEREKRKIAAARSRAATPVFGKSERAVAPARQRASSGS